MDTLTAVLSRYIAQTKFEDIPADTVEYAKLLIMDSIGCAIGGSRLKPGELVIDFFTQLGGCPEAAILATGKKLPCITAAYVNSYLANVLDFDDTFSLAFGHPGATIIPPGVALAEKIRASGKQLIVAVVTAYEGWGRINQAIAASPERRAKVFGLGTHQIFGAAIVCSKLMGFNSEQTANALGIAGANAPVPSVRKQGLDDRPVNWVKNNFGWASMGGVLAALLTEEGFLGHRYILDGEKGFWIMSGSDRCHFDKMTLNLGTHYLIRNTGFKPYASCRWTHSSLDATATIMAKHTVQPDRITHIKVATIGEVVNGFGFANPRNIVDAQFSLPYLIALELLGKSPRRGLSADDLTDHNVCSIAAKVSLEISPEMEERFQENKKFSSAEVSIEQIDGTVFSERVDIPKWDPETAPTREALYGKFADLTAPIIGKSVSQAVADDLEHLENIADVSSIISRISTISK